MLGALGDGGLLGEPAPLGEPAVSHSVVDALYDAELAALTLSAVTGADESIRGTVLIGDSEDGITLNFENQWSLTAFPWLYPGANPAVIRSPPATPRGLPG